MSKGLSQEARDKIAAAARERWGKTREKHAAKESKSNTKKLPRSAPAKEPVTHGTLEIVVGGEGIVMLDPATVRRSPFNREYFDEEALKKLIENVRENGVLQPGIVRPLDPPEGKVKYEIIAGERRWRAATSAKRPYPAIVRIANDRDALEIQAVENTQREDLNPVDEATKFEQLRTKYEEEGNNRTAAIMKICSVTGKAQATIYERLSLLKLPSNVLSFIQRGALPPSHAVLLTKISNPGMAVKMAQTFLKPGAHEEKDEKGVISFRDAKRMAEEEVKKEKNQAEYQKVREKFTGNVLDRKQSAKVIYSYGSGQFSIQDREYVQGDQQCHADATYRNYAKLWKKPPPAVLLQHEDGRPITLYLRKDADQAAKDGGKLKAEAKGKSKKSPEETLRDSREKERETQYAGVLGNLLVAAESTKEGIQLWRNLIVLRSHNHTYAISEFNECAKRRGRGDNAIAKIEEFSLSELKSIFFELVLSGTGPYRHSMEWNLRLVQCCEFFGIHLPPWEDPNFQTPGDAAKSNESDEEEERE